MNFLPLDDFLFSLLVSKVLWTSLVVFLISCSQELCVFFLLKMFMHICRKAYGCQIFLRAIEKLRTQFGGTHMQRGETIPLFNLRFVFSENNVKWRRIYIRTHNGDSPYRCRSILQTMLHLVSNKSFYNFPSENIELLGFWLSGNSHFQCWHIF